MPACTPGGGGGSTRVALDGAPLVVAGGAGGRTLAGIEMFGVTQAAWGPATDFSRRLCMTMATYPGTSPAGIARGGTPPGSGAAATQRRLLHGQECQAGIDCAVQRPARWVLNGGGGGGGGVAATYSSRLIGAPAAGGSNRVSGAVGFAQAGTGTPGADGSVIVVPMASGLMP